MFIVGIPMDTITVKTNLSRSLFQQNDHSIHLAWRIVSTCLNLETSRSSKGQFYDLVPMGSFSPIAAGRPLADVNGPMMWVTSISRQRTVGIIIGPKAARRVVKSTETNKISMLFRMRLSRFCYLLIPTETKKKTTAHWGQDTFTRFHS